jgi:hypothetical protein
MGRIREFIEVNGNKYWTLFDSGARNTYVTPRVASHLATTELPKALKSALGGGIQKTSKAALLVARVEGHNISTNAYVLNEIGRDEEGKAIDVLFGALAMQQWAYDWCRRKSGSIGLIIPRNLWNTQFGLQMDDAIL